ncbi:unnamed protein product, partial [Durusdinium trenchii]
MTAFSVWLFGNSHTAVNYRVPLCPATHDPECQRNCLQQTTAGKLQRLMQQAARRATRYFTGYLQKPQPVGRKELQQAAKQLHFLHTNAGKDPTGTHYRKVASRVFGDLEFRCSVRPITEEFMLAGFGDSQDPTAAECIRSFPVVPFVGAEWLTYLDGRNEIRYKVKPAGYTTTEIKLSEVYGWRGQDTRVYYLSPWEFVKWWTLKKLRPPPNEGPVSAECLSEWMPDHDPTSIPEDGWQFGRGYCWKEKLPTSQAETILRLPEQPFLAAAAEYYLERHSEALVPYPTVCPLPRPDMSKEDQARLLNVYLRPWTLDANAVSLRTSAQQIAWKVSPGIPELPPSDTAEAARRAAAAERPPAVRWIYGNLNETAAADWLRSLQQAETGPVPTPEQTQFLQAIINRCLTETTEEQTQRIGKSEPWRGICHGVPGAGKSQTLKWLRRFFEELCGWHLQTEFVYLAPQNTQAALIQGMTLHAFANIRIKAKGQGGERERGPDQFVQYQRLRWLVLDEISTVGLEVLATLEKKVASLQKVLWSRTESGLHALFELTTEQRCVDPWLSLVLKQARHSAMSQDVWCFLHGFPTRYRAWDFDTKACLCGTAACQTLPLAWATTPDLPWEARLEQECPQCRIERRRRCLLGRDPKSAKFAAQPFIHGLKAAKYIATNLRAREVAVSQQQTILWVIAADTPLFHLDTDAPAELQARKSNWLQRHDQATGGIVGILPLLPNMPIRITQTLPELKPFGLFKNTRGTLYSWTLHELDIARLSRTTPGAELVLEKLPLALYVQIPGSTWQLHPALPPGVACIKPTVQQWTLQPGGRATIARRGFPVASDYSGTAHSFMGATLEACTLELTGPHTYLEFHRKKLSLAQAKARFEKDAPKRRRQPDVMLYCRNCSPRSNMPDRLLPLRDFVTVWDREAWYKILEQGMDRLCPQRRSPESGKQPPTPTDAPDA